MQPHSVASDPVAPTWLRVLALYERDGAGVRFTHIPQTAIAAELSRSRRAVQRALSHLTAAGYLVKRLRPSPRGGRLDYYRATQAPAPTPTAPTAPPPTTPILAETRAP